MEDKDDAWIDVRNTWPYQDKGWKFINDGKNFFTPQRKMDGHMCIDIILRQKF